jgi:hypothetical protein
MKINSDLVSSLESLVSEHGAEAVIDTLVTFDPDNFFTLTVLIQLARLAKKESLLLKTSHAARFFQNNIMSYDFFLVKAICSSPNTL